MPSNNIIFQPLSKTVHLLVGMKKMLTMLQHLQLAMVSIRKSGNHIEFRNIVI